MPRDTLLDFFHPATAAGAGPVYTNSFDSMSRLTGLTDQSNNTDVSGVQYNVANQLLDITYFGAAETRQYNSLLQLTSLGVTGSGSVNRTYNYPTAGTNNGQINSEIRSGETITYQYDSLKRLISASSSSSWTDTYGYDAFGNLVSMTPSGGAPQLSLGVNPADNQIEGQTYDANGNELSAPQSGTLTYDSENRLLTGPGIQYAYDSANKRVWAGTLNGSGNLTGQEVFVYGANGHMLGEYAITVGSSSLTVAATRVTVYFGKKRIGVITSTGTKAFTPDALGSNGQFYAYGEIKGSNNPLDTWSFATYWRDSATGLDYANNRYFTNQFGRFMTPDPYSDSADPSDPQSWNLYAYTLGDPVNANDPQGLLPVNWHDRPLPVSSLLPSTPAAGSSPVNWRAPQPQGGSGDDGSDGDDPGGDTNECGPGWETDASLSGPCGNGIIQVGGPYGDSISINMTSINNMVCQALILSFANDGGAWNPLCGGPPTLLVGDGTNCVVALAKLAIQTTTVSGRLALMILIGDRQPGHLKSLAEAVNRLINILNQVKRSCATKVGAAAAIAEAEAALAAAESYLAAAAIIIAI